MTFAFGHLLSGWIAGKGIERIKKIKISHYAWFFLLFGAILPDADYIIDWTLDTHLHRTISHSLIFLIAVPSIFYLTLHVLKHKEKAALPFFLGIGIFTHLLLDIFTSSPHGIPIFWPNLLHFSITNVSYIDPVNPSFLNGTPSQLQYYLKLAIIDMAIGTAWLFYLWWKKRIQF